VKGKNNLSPPDIKSLAYSFGVRDVGTDKRTGKTISAPHILWHPGHVDVTGNEAMQAARHRDRDDDVENHRPR
jgi:hypothetical protein